MSLEAAIHDQWSATPALVALVPEERVVTGAARGEVPLPYVILTREKDAARVRTSSGVEVSDTTIRFDIRVADLDEGKSIAEAIRERFNRQSFALAGGTCLVMQWASEQERSETDGGWGVSVEYLARVATETAV